MQALQQPNSTYQSTTSIALFIRSSALPDTNPAAASRLYAPLLSLSPTLTSILLASAFTVPLKVII